MELLAELMGFYISEVGVHVAYAYHCYFAQV